MPFPLLFTLSTSTRHEIISLRDFPPSFSELKATIARTIPTSPNCAEFMAKYAKKPDGGDDADVVGDIKVRWSTVGRDSRIWPAATLMTEENCEALLRLMDNGKDVLEVGYGEKKE
ncbi:hypothetical protein EJ05DRAFT_475172 [Pseudovirgaria hyperparasitica]|uniref:Uncharacterized protein n=1 Tax=Pseudovirgaria hyperparasitica TaxID=470096 RepID=A0A6A6W9U5_9PEZI|nr:uncharacterized protein EJ05DRAFT_475172 [Pseudovirgaria hyperparasitica]KAF2758929.1 hypothetical protein EJ05DRAFT_475172 [Pseudovirgaria hyperparasitica]